MPGLIDLPASMIRSTRGDFQFAGEAVDEDFAARDAVGEIQERRAASGLAVEIDAGRGVEPALAEADALFVCLANHLRETDDRSRRDPAVEDTALPRSGYSPARRQDHRRACASIVGGHFAPAAGAAARRHRRPPRH